MPQNTITITVYDKRLDMTWDMYVTRVAENIFRAVENELFNNSITIGTEFQTRINKEGKHQIVKITKAAPYYTRRFLLSIGVSTADYQLLGDEIVKHGGHWQVDMGGIATVNLPPGCSLDLDEIFKAFNHWPAEIKD